MIGGTGPKGQLCSKMFIWLEEDWRDYEESALNRIKWFSDLASKRVFNDV